MTILQIKCFLTMAGCKRYSEASAQLHLNQTIFCKCIRNLESELSVELFLKTPSGVQMTEAGQALYPHLQYILAQHGAMVEDADKFRPSPPVVLDIGCMYFSTYYNLLEFSAGFQEENPGIRLKLDEYRAADLNEKLELHELSAVFIYKEFLRRHYQRVIPLREDEIVAVMNAQNASRYPDSIRLEELKGEQFILMQGDSMIHHYLQTACIDAGFVPNELMLDLRLETICELLKGNRLVSLLIRSFAESMLTDDSLVILPVKNGRKLTLSLVVADASPASEYRKVASYLSSLRTDEIP